MVAHVTFTCANKGGRVVRQVACMPHVRGVGIPVDLNGQASAHLGPYKRHLGPQAKLAACLFDAVLGAAERSPKHVGDVGVCHAHAVVLLRKRDVALFVHS